LRPEPIPLNVKVILTGTPFLYYILYNYDDEYRELFKVKADFDTRMPRNEENIKKYAQFIRLCQAEEELLPFHKSAVARIVEYGSRLADHQEKLSTQFSSIADLIKEANFWAKKDGEKIVYAQHVKKALEQRFYRSASIEEKLRELILEDVLIVDTYDKKSDRLMDWLLLILEITVLASHLVLLQGHILGKLELSISSVKLRCPDGFMRKL